MKSFNTPFYNQGYQAYYKNKSSFPPSHVPKDKHNEWRQGWLEAWYNYVKDSDYD